MAAQPEPSAEYGGECAFAVSVGKKGLPGKPGLYAVRDGKRYLFSNPVAKLLWKLLPGRKEKADANWSAR